jgi:hypothetical protein
MPTQLTERQVEKLASFIGNMSPAFKKSLAFRLDNDSNQSSIQSVLTAANKDVSPDQPESKKQPKPPKPSKPKSPKKSKKSKAEKGEKNSVKVAKIAKAFLHNGVPSQQFTGKTLFEWIKPLAAAQGIQIEIRTPLWANVIKTLRTEEVIHLSHGHLWMVTYKPISKGNGNGSGHVDLSASIVSATVQ